MGSVWTRWAATGVAVKQASSPTPHSPPAYVSSVLHLHQISISLCLSLSCFRPLSLSFHSSLFVSCFLSLLFSINLPLFLALYPSLSFSLSRSLSFSPPLPLHLSICSSLTLVFSSPLPRDCRSSTLWESSGVKPYVIQPVILIMSACFFNNTFCDIL